jgi:hypothetical protein
MMIELPVVLVGRKTARQSAKEKLWDNWALRFER